MDSEITDSAPTANANRRGWVVPNAAFATAALAVAATLFQSEPVYLAALAMSILTGVLAAIRWRKRGRFGWSLPLAFIAMIFGTWSFLALERLQHAARSSSCRLAQLALALHNYHETHGHLPGPAICGSAGRPLLSWRVAILPFIEEQELFARFHLDEPWDSPHNLKLLPQIPSTFAPYPDVVAEPTTTLFQAFVGPGTAFERSDLTLNDFSGRTGSTILLVESSVGVPWTKPTDLAYDPSGPLPQLGRVYRRRMLLPVEQPAYFRAAMADGSSRSIPKTISEKTLRALISRNDGEPGADWNEMN